MYFKRKQAEQKLRLFFCAAITKTNRVDSHIIKHKIVYQENAA